MSKRDIAADRKGVYEQGKRDGLIKTDKDGNEYAIAPNGKRSNLTVGQWVEVRTKRFKRWFGDWLQAQHKRFLDGDPVFKVNKNKFESNATPANIAKFYQDNYNGKVLRHDLGEVDLTARGIRHSLIKGQSWFKIAAFEAVPAVIEKGVVIDSQKNWDGKGGDTYTVSAPVAIQGKPNIVSVVIKRDGRGNRFKVHRVDLVEHLRQNASYKSSAAQGETTSAPAGDVRSILQNIFAVNENDASKVVDENGEPMVVYHGTDADIEAFELSKMGHATAAQSAGNAFWFVHSPVVAKDYAHNAVHNAPFTRIEQQVNAAEERGDFDRSDALLAESERLDQDLRDNPLRGQNIVPVFLNIRNMPEMDAKGELFSASEEDINDFLDDAKANADGVLIKNLDDSPAFSDRVADHYAAFKPNQIKSATGNIGTYSEQDSILKHIEGENVETASIRCMMKMEI